MTGGSRGDLQTLRETGRDHAPRRARPEDVALRRRTRAELLRHRRNTDIGGTWGVCSAD